jgi:hypothetical protein
VLLLQKSGERSMTVGQRGKRGKGKPIYYEMSVKKYHKNMIRWLYKNVLRGRGILLCHQVIQFKSGTVIISKP